MKQRFCFRFLVGFLMLFSSISCLSVEKISEVLLIKGSPKSASLLSEDSGKLEGESLLVANQYKVRLESVALVKGKGNITKEVTVQLSASHIESVTGEEEIFVVLQKLDDGSLEVLYWGVPQNIICVPNDLMTNANLERSFNAFNRYDGFKCSSFK
ncbi:hypothetical protein [Microbulbifer sp.]|uniref:hypothetical protein n=1 Tax=Microbulbifer sp. TaxID=1908541 RepID=UPI003F3F93EC